MIPQVVCLLLPIAGECPVLVRNVPKISAVMQRKAYYTGKTISVTGRVRSLDQWTLANHGQAELFAVCDGPCVQVFMRMRSPIHDGMLVTVSGQYYETYHAGRRAFHNEIEADHVVPRE